ncbi:MAG: bifunctional adenosylcobinamide kinase/adenosylcobinamide-phosphate guanylyltransferase [Eubacteriales bacterium]|nr:bifunctional adenosylcobinamide kinase/adenosylcobinamide-phosphate guanylyltransferase [Eubacteriales bacterium]
MILVVGSEGSGKREYVKSLGYRDEELSCSITGDKPVLYHLEKLVFADPEGTDGLLADALKKEVVICSEVGSGVIPALYSERVGREATGRLCILLAREADAVVRMVCGIPQVIKGEAPGIRKI